MSKNYNHSDYGKNRYSAEIIYSGADGEYAISLEAFLASNPSLTEEDYAFWKSWSDEDYKAKDRADTLEARRTLCIDQFTDTELLSTESAEDEVLEELEPAPNPYTYENAMRILDACLTAIQKRRYLKYHQGGMTVRDIAIEEGVHHSSVDESIQAAEKKIKNFFETA